MANLLRHQLVVAGQDAHGNAMFVQAGDGGAGGILGGIEER